jgi:hypothetical protein
MTTIVSIEPPPRGPSRRLQRRPRRTQYRKQRPYQHIRRPRAPNGCFLSCGRLRRLRHVHRALRSETSLPGLVPATCLPCVGRAPVCPRALPAAAFGQCPPVTPRRLDGPVSVVHRNLLPSSAPKRVLEKRAASKGAFPPGGTRAVSRAPLPWLFE